MSTSTTCILRLLACGLLVSGLPLAPTASAHGDVEGVIAAVSQEIAKAATVDLLLLRARLHLEHGDHANAVMDCARAQVLVGAQSIEAAAIARCLGQVLLADGQEDEALAAFDRSLALKPHDGDTLEMRAQALRQIDRPAEALRTCDERETCLPLPQPQFYLDRLAIQRAVQRPVAELVAGLEQGLRRLGPLIVLEKAALQIEVEAGQTDAALMRLDRLTRAAARPESWLVQRGDLLRRLGRQQEARAAYAAAIAAIEQLPAARRQTTATQHLSQLARNHLADLPLESRP